MSCCGWKYKNSYSSEEDCHETCCCGIALCGGLSSGVSAAIMGIVTCTCVSIPGFLFGVIPGAICCCVSCGYVFAACDTYCEYKGCSEEKHQAPPKQVIIELQAPPKQVIKEEMNMTR